jgi:nicotinate-nucleotide adenylyltransferase
VPQDPLTLSLSPRGEGTPERPSFLGERPQPDSLSPWGEGWGEGVFAVSSTGLHKCETRNEAERLCMSAPSPAPADLRPPPALGGMRIGLLGGSFNPPHAAHRLISLTALKRLALDRVWWMVTPGNPLKEHGGLLPLARRIELCRQVSKHPRIKVTAFEASIGTAYTERSLSFLCRRFPGVQFVWLMGADNLASFHRWKEWETIFRLMPMAVEDRPVWRYRALSSPAATRFASARIPEAHAATLPSLAAPAWCYLSGPLSKLSSTALRALRGEAGR